MTCPPRAPRSGEDDYDSARPESTYGDFLATTGGTAPSLPY